MSSCQPKRAETWRGSLCSLALYNTCTQLCQMSPGEFGPSPKSWLHVCDTKAWNLGFGNQRFTPVLRNYSSQHGQNFEGPKRPVCHNDQNTRFFPPSPLRAWSGKDGKLLSTCDALQHRANPCASKRICAGWPSWLIHGFEKKVPRHKAWAFLPPRLIIKSIRCVLMFSALAVWTGTGEVPPSPA